MKPYLLIIMLIFMSPLGGLQAENVFKSHSSVANAFRSINYDIYLIEETKNYCDTNFPDQVTRNAEAYDSWELKYNFFLREMDNNYDLWKSGFSELLQQQFSTLDANARKQAYLEVSKNFSDGAADKCFNFKPSLSRPRSNVELNHEQAVSLIRNQKFSNFKNDRGTTGASELCQWEQGIALKTAQQRSEGMDKKTQMEMLKVMRNEKSGLDKKEHSLRVKKYAETIDEAYQAQNIHAPAFSQYRFARCERDNNNFSSAKFKQVLPALESCQQNSEDFSKLAACINRSLD